MFFPLQNCLPSRRPPWTDIYRTDIISRWRHEWKSAPVVNCSLVDNLTIRQPGSDLPRRYWALLNCFQTKEGHCASCQKKWGLAATDVPLWQMPNDVTLSTAAHRPSWRVGGSDCTQLMIVPLNPGHTAHKCTRQQQQHYRTSSHLWLHSIMHYKQINRII